MEIVWFTLHIFDHMWSLNDFPWLFDNTMPCNENNTCGRLSIEDP